MENTRNMAANQVENKKKTGSKIVVTQKMKTPLGRTDKANETTQNVLKTALQLAYDGGIENATVERITQHCGVAKTTIYRRWPNAATIVMDAFFADIGPSIPFTEKKTLVATFIAAISQLRKALDGRRSQLLCRLLAASQQNQELQNAFWKKWIMPRREQAKLMIERSRARGELRQDVDADILADMVFGPIYYRMMIPYAPLSDAYVKAYINNIFAGVLASKP
jgi:AcrR family transcriptional regulator